MPTMKKRIFMLIVALAAAFGVAGCDTNDPGATTTTVPGTPDPLGS